MNVDKISFMTSYILSRFPSSLSYRFFIIHFLASSLTGLSFNCKKNLKAPGGSILIYKVHPKTRVNAGILR